MRFLTSIILLSSCLTAWSQVDPGKLTSGNLESGKWNKLEKSIRKSLAKDSLNPEARYLLSLFYFNSGHFTFNTDSAYRHVQGASRDLTKSSDPEKEKLKKIPLDSNILSRLKNRIDSAAYEKAKRSNTLEAYEYFIRHHARAREVASATELRDEVAFLEALKSNTWSSFSRFLSQYPNSHRKEEARERYEKLLFEDKTHDRQLTSYVVFYRDYPASPYRKDAEKNIFELATVSGSPGSFRWFIRFYPESVWSKRAKNILYNLRETEGKKIFDEGWFSDSLKRVESLNSHYWVPVFKSGRFGFMDEEGSETLAPQFEELLEDYKCGNIIETVLVTSLGLMGRDGALIWKGKVKEAESLGVGFIKVSTDSATFVVHESGFAVETKGVEDARVLASRFLALKKNNKWSIQSLVGKELYPFVFEDLDAFDSLIVLTRNGKKFMTTPERLSRDAFRKDPVDNLVFDDLKRWGSRQYWVRNGLMEGVLDARLNFLIPLDRQVLRKTTFGFLREKDKKFYVEGIRRLENIPYRSVTEQANWVRLENQKGWSIYEKTFNQLLEGDSAWFQGQIAFLLKQDSISAILPSGQRISFHEKSPFKLLENKDSTAWIVLDEKKKKSVFDAASGIRLFSLELDHIEPMASRIFLVTKAGKKGLMADDGKMLLPLEFDAIVPAGDHAFSLLKNKKFGWYDIRTKVLMKPLFDRNIKPYNHHFCLAFHDKGYAFIRPDGTPVGNFEWEDFQFWTDSSAWVKRNFQWMLISIASQKVKIDRVRNFSSILDTPQEKIVLVRQDNAMGVISNRKNVIVPIHYSDIVNLGSAEVPLYMTERHIEEAGISVVVYYDRHGKIIRKQAMESEEFEKIYCDN